ncbi:MAG: hypothetical protein ACWA5Q_08950 [bacterium]
MSVLVTELKRILSGLAQQYSGDHIPPRKKLQALGIDSRTTASSSEFDQSLHFPRRIGLIAHEDNVDACLNYVIQSCHEHHATIDLLLSDDSDAQHLAEMQQHIEDKGFRCQKIRLGKDQVNGLTTYVDNHPTLKFIVATQEDSLARTMLSDVIPRQHERFPVPIVTIPEPATLEARRRSAA